VLQVYKGSDYHSAADVDKLRTMWLGYIPKDKVQELASQMRSTTSAFYTGYTDITALGVASHVNSNFNLLSANDGEGDAGNNGGSGTGNVGSSNGAAKSDNRQDVIIGVCSALGGLAVLILGYLAYRAIQRKREAAHRRLSDPPFVGARPDGRDFDQDSVGGQRRRSFYFAEDSLRGFQSPENERGGYDDGGYFSSQGQSSMTQRRPVMPSTISAPILRENSMNW